MCLCVLLWMCICNNKVSQLPSTDQLTADQTVCVCVCLALLLLAGNGMFFFPVTVHADSGEKCELWFMAFGICSRFWIHFHLFGGEISSMPGKTTACDTGKRVWHPARERKTQQSMVGVMTKNNSTLPHKRGSSNMILTLVIAAVCIRDSSYYRSV